MATYHDYQPSLHPTALAGPYGLAWGSTSGAMKDAAVALAVDAVEAGLVLLAPDDALSYLGADTQILPLPGMSTESYRVRIAAAWETWVWAGTRKGLLDAISLFGTVNAAIFTGREWAPDGRADLWARWWALIPAADHDFHPDGAWDDAGAWDDGGTWDSDAPPDDVLGRQLFLRQVTNARDRGYLRLIFDASVDFYDDGGVWDGGEIDDTVDDDTWVDDPAFLEIEL